MMSTSVILPSSTFDSRHKCCRRQRSTDDPSLLPPSNVESSASLPLAVQVHHSNHRYHQTIEGLILRFYLWLSKSTSVTIDIINSFHLRANEATSGHRDAVWQWAISRC